MHIVVVGAGEVGSFLAERLSREGHDIAVIERDRAKLSAIASRLDVLTVEGTGASPMALAEAGIDKCSLMVAVTNVDETNLLACSLAKHAGVKSTVARIESGELRGAAGKKLRSELGIDVVIDPDAETADEILELLEFPGTSEVVRMAGGDLVIIGVRIPEHAPMVGKTLQRIAADYEPNWEFLFGAIVRDDRTIIPRGDHRIEPGEFVRIVCKERARREILGQLGLSRSLPRRVMVLGGGRVGEAVAAQLERRRVRVTIIERDGERARELAEQLGHSIVLKGEITDADLLFEEGAGRADAVIALTGEDDANVLACLYSKSLGAGETIAVVHRLELLPLLPHVGVDVALSPRTASANAVLRLVRGGVESIATALEGEAEVVELEVAPGSPADGALVAELQLPKDVLVGGVVRDGKGQIARGRTQLRARDHLVVFALPHAIEHAKSAFS